MMQNLQQYQDEYKLFYSHLEAIGHLAEREDAEVQLITFSGCDLYEPQKGKRVTQRETQSGGRPFIGTRVGPVFIGGSGRSTSHSTSTTVQMPDELGHVDSGALVVSSRALSFVGEMHTRTIKFLNIVASPGEEKHITIASSTRQTVSVVDFPHAADMWITCLLIDTAEQFAARRLDTSGKVTAEELNAEYIQRMEAQEMEIERAFGVAYGELETVNGQLRDFAATYPTRVTNPGPPVVFTPRKRMADIFREQEFGEPESTEKAASDGADSTSEPITEVESVSASETDSSE